MPQGASRDLNGMKMKLRHSSVVSVLPAHDIFWNNPCRFSFHVFHVNLSKRRRISSTVSQKRQVSVKVGMGADQYLPPWFRWASMFSSLFAIHNEFDDFMDLLA